MAAFTFFGLCAPVHAQFLGSASSFAVLAGSTVTNTGSSVLSGDLGVWPGTAITGFPPGIVVNGSVYEGGAVAQQAQADLTIAYDLLEGEAFDEDLTGEDLGARTLFAGVYSFDNSAQLTGDLILDANGDSNARFVFQIGSTLTTATNASVTVINGGGGNNVYWQVGSFATLGTGTEFTGNILAMTSITLNTGANINQGRALAREGAVTLVSNNISAPVPEPASMFLLTAAGLVAAAARRRRRLAGD